MKILITFKNLLSALVLMLAYGAVVYLVFSMFK
jgi:hypothetical protein